MKALWLGLLFVSCLHAAPPAVDAVYPAGGMRGRDVSVELVGKVPDEELQFWSSDPGITFQVVEKKRMLQVADTCPLGAHWLRFYNAEGTALPQLFVVGDIEERNEVEPNDTASEAEEISAWPALVNGRLAKSGDVDVYACSLAAGQSLRAEVVAYRLDSPVDPLLRLADAQGNVLAWNHDRYDSLDAQLEYTAISAGDFYLMVAGFVYPPAARSRFEGSSQTVYRLSISEGKSVDEGVVMGLIAEAGEEDTLALEAEKGLTYEIVAKAQSLNSPLDPWLEVRDSEGKVLAKNDDSAGVDASLSWKAPATASYTIALRDLLRKGGKDYHYEIFVIEAKPSFEVTVRDHAWTLEQGTMAEIPLKVLRKHGHARPVTVTFEELPLELDTQSVTIPGSNTEGVLRLSGTESMTMIRLSATDGLVTSQVSYPFKGATTEAGALLENDLEDLLLIVQKK